MNTPQHTQGPWTVSTDDERNGVYYLHLAGFINHKENEANARLIETAPKLLEALQEADAHQPDVQELRKVADAILSGPLLGNQKEYAAQLLQQYARFIRVARAAIAEATKG